MLVNVDVGCYPGCYYYTDSCFRKDCKLVHGTNETKKKPVEEVKRFKKPIQSATEHMVANHTIDVKMIQ